MRQHHRELALSEAGKRPCQAERERGNREPAPHAKTRERKGGRSHDRKVDVQRPEVRLAGGDQDRRHVCADQAEARECRPVQQRRCEGRACDQAEQNEGRARREEIVERVGSIDVGIGDGGAGRGQDAGDMRRRQAGDSRQPLGAARPFAGDDEHERQQGAERNAHAGPDETLLDRVTHEKDAAERQRDAADPHRPLGAEALLEAHGGRGHRGRRWNGWNGRGGRLAPGRRRRRWCHRLRPRRDRCIGFGNRLCRSGCCRSRTGGGRRTFERREPRIDAAQLPAEVHGLHERDDSEKGSRQSQGHEQEEEQFHGRIAEPRCLRCYRTHAPRQRRAPFGVRPVGVEFFQRPSNREVHDAARSC